MFALLIYLSISIIIFKFEPLEIFTNLEKGGECHAGESTNPFGFLLDYSELVLFEDFEVGMLVKNSKKAFG
jgi:hypothetical protein